MNASSEPEMEVAASPDGQVRILSHRPCRLLCRNSRFGGNQSVLKCWLDDIWNRMVVCGSPCWARGYALSWAIGCTSPLALSFQLVQG